MVRYSQMPVGFGPCLLLEGKQERKVGAVIVLAAEDSKGLEGICRDVGHVFSGPELSICTIGRSCQSQRCDGYICIQDYESNQRLQ